MEGAQQSMEKIRSRGISSLAAAGEAVGQLRAEVSNKKTCQITLMDDRCATALSHAKQHAPVHGKAAEG
jgi:hypothetical protein